MSLRQSATALGLADLVPDRITDQWQIVMGEAPPPISPLLLVPILAYAIQSRGQERQLTDLQRQLDQLIAARDSPQKPRNPAGLKMQVGMVLQRNWQGVPYRVIVVEGGFSYEGQTYRSLSEIARLITGTRWSGPAFFGLKGKGRVIHEG
jgi:hypothetical protein